MWYGTDDKFTILLLLYLPLRQAAQEKEALQRTGDELDAKISAAELEVAGLEATLAQMAASNTSFAASLKGGDKRALGAEQAGLRWVERLTCLLVISDATIAILLLPQ
jgi:hypothetical protein